MLSVRLHRAPVAPATPAYEPELGRLLRLAQKGFYWQGERLAELTERLKRLADRA